MNTLNDNGSDRDKGAIPALRQGDSLSALTSGGTGHAGFKARNRRLACATLLATQHMRLT